MDFKIKKIMKEAIRIYYKKKLLAIFFPRNIKIDKLKFFTKEDNPFQIGIHERKKNEILPSHIHRLPETIKIKTIQEILYVQRGKIKVSLFTKKGKKIKALILRKDESILLIDGGHGVEVLENSRIFEIKQGPYFGSEHAKVYFRFNKNKENKQLL